MNEDDLHVALAHCDRATTADRCFLAGLVLSGCADISLDYRMGALAHLLARLCPLAGHHPLALCP